MTNSIRYNLWLRKLRGVGKKKGVTALAGERVEVPYTLPTNPIKIADLVADHVIPSFCPNCDAIVEQVSIDITEQGTYRGLYVRYVCATTWFTNDDGTDNGRIGRPMSDCTTRRVAKLEAERAELLASVETLRASKAHLERTLQ